MIHAGRGQRRVAALVVCLAACQPLPRALSAQGIAFSAHAGAAASSLLARDVIANPSVRRLIGSAVDDDVQLAATPGLMLGAGVRVPLRPHLVLDVAADWTISELSVREGMSTRRLQGVAIIAAAASVSRALQQRVEAGGGVGLMAYVTERHGLFRDGSRLAPMIEARASWVAPFAGDRLALVMRGQLHRFGTPVIREAGGADGTVGRIAVQARVRLAALGR